MLIVEGTYCTFNSAGPEMKGAEVEALASTLSDEAPCGPHLVHKTWQKTSPEPFRQERLVHTLVAVLQQLRESGRSNPLA